MIVGSYHDASGDLQGFLLSEGIYTTLHFNGTTSPTTIPFGINNSGQIVGGYGSHGFLRSNQGIYTTLDFPGYGTYLTGINDSGQIVGVLPLYNEFNVYPEQGFLLSGGNYLTLDIPGATTSYAAGINDSGQIVGTAGTDNGAFHSFIGSPETIAATTTTIRSGPSPVKLRPDDDFQRPGGQLQPKQHGGADRQRAVLRRWPELRRARTAERPRRGAHDR